MKKYVLNIEKLYTGQTANALVLDQVDEDFPTLLPSVPEGETDLLGWIRTCKSVNPQFKPPSLRLTRERLNECIVDFNLEQQAKFKEKGHSELYMMDDTNRMKPNLDELTQTSEKTYLHCLDGKAPVETDDGELEVNSSQLNVIFPYRKMSSKSLYSSSLKVESALDIDGILERARGITLQGKVSYEKCLQAHAQVGNNMYVMSPTVEVNSRSPHINGNGMTVVNSYTDKPYFFPDSMTLFQPSQSQYDGPNLAKDSDGLTDFIKWYRKYSRKSVVTTLDIYGGNTSTLKYKGPGSYELELATYSPSGMVLSVTDMKGEIKEKVIEFNSSTYQKIRGNEDKDNSYENKKYLFDNSVLDYMDESGVEHFGEVGFMFNMYDTFITGNDRIVKMVVPRDKDFNKLVLKFDWEVRLDPGLLGEFEALLVLNEDVVFDFPYENQDSSGSYSLDIPDTVFEDHEMTFSIRIIYDVDFAKRSQEREYKEMLKRSGVLIRNIRIENGVTAPLERLTFGSYVNEVGIDEEEWKKRYYQFWEVSQYKKDLAYQTVVETPLKNLSSSGIKYLNNYSSGDLYGDMFLTKSVLDSRYDMNICVDPMDKNTLLAIGRDYLGMGECSNQLSLIFKETDISISQDENGKVVTRRKPHVENDLNYQMVEVVKNINRFESSIKHKMNVFSVVVENSNLAPDDSESRDETLERYKEQMRNSVTQFVRNTCEGIVPVHTQLFDVQFT